MLGYKLIAFAKVNLCDTSPWWYIKDISSSIVQNIIFICQRNLFLIGTRKRDVNTWLSSIEVDKDSWCHCLPFSIVICCFSSDYFYFRLLLSVKMWRFHMMRSLAAFLSDQFFAVMFWWLDCWLFSVLLENKIEIWVVNQTFEGLSFPCTVCLSSLWLTTYNFRWRTKNKCSRSQFCSRWIWIYIVMIRCSVFNGCASVESGKELVFGDRISGILILHRMVKLKQHDFVSW